MSDFQTTKSPMVVVFTPDAEALCGEDGLRHVLLANSVQAFLDREGHINSEVAFFDQYIFLIPEGANYEHIRDGFAMRIGDEACRCAYLPETAQAVMPRVLGARPMWTDEIAIMQVIPHEGERFP
jgi:hypothetical protein